HEANGRIMAACVVHKAALIVKTGIDTEEGVLQAEDRGTAGTFAEEGVVFTSIIRETRVDAKERVMAAGLIRYACTAAEERIVTAAEIAGAGIHSKEGIADTYVCGCRSRAGSRIDRALRQVAVRYIHLQGADAVQVVLSRRVENAGFAASINIEVCTRLQRGL